MKTTNEISEQATASSLLEDLKSSETKTKINAIKGLHIIAFALGKERTRNELLPFLADCIDEEEDETLIELAKALATFLEDIGGKAYAGKLFKIIELLLVLDELSVRSEALKSMKTILGQINPSDYENDIVDLINRLSLSEYSSHKQSAINLIPNVFKILSKQNKEVAKGHLTKFANEESPMIKKELAIGMKDLALLLDEETYTNIISLLVKDTNDTVRIPLMDDLVALKSHPNLAKLQDFINGALVKLSTDDSWRVRLTVADKINELLSFPFLSLILKSNIVDAYAQLFEDQEAEVRNICCLRLESVCEKIGKDDSVDKVLAQLKKVEKDTVGYVRGALASTILRSCPLVGKSKTNDFIFPIFLNLIKDESHDIRMTLIKTLDKLHEVINIDIFIQSIIPSIIEIANNKIWRIRIQVTESIPVIAKIMGNKALFFENILPICLNCLTDDVFSIREAGCKLIKKLYENFKGTEFEKILVDKVGEMKASQNYLIRNTALFMIKEFADDSNSDFLAKKLMPIVFKMSKDKVSNVRMNCAFVLKKVAASSKNKDILTEVYASLDELKKDSDQDVVNAVTDN